MSEFRHARGDEIPAQRFYAGWYVLEAIVVEATSP